MGAYMTEIFRAGIQAIGRGQIEAAHSLGMTYGQLMKRVVLPQAMRLIIPPTGNEFIAMLKDSALVNFLGVWELFFQSIKIGRQNFKSMETLIIAGLFTGWSPYFFSISSPGWRLGWPKAHEKQLEWGINRHR